ncbi:YggS family pyridoxal phosphate-dependent enzyme [Clostridium niameyense]|uniref:YggS family pyridoxal phosphate-dependent enzyme n=1 Tax=Clostridium niameyense TaxID=1622073 RepID=UPI00067F717C|nr:YggS family pyridoxal phosphate-dependent enzyme [Clostridium niameyense]
MSVKGNIVKYQSVIPNNVSIIAVSKTKPIECIEEAYEVGIRDFGENKVQELIEKVDYFKQKQDIRWHLIGHLQRNKVKYIVGKVHLIHSLDSVRLLNEIESRYKKQSIVANTLIQINIGKEESKYGINEEELEYVIKAVENCDNVRVKGLMTIIPKGSEDQCRQYFKKMNNIFKQLKRRTFKNIQMQYLSMGMTGDYMIAIEEGSNMVRIGQGIFGKRNYDK